MSKTQSDHLCHSCQANWSTDEWSVDCRECGGGALERDCTFCKGRCGGTSGRAIMDSHDFARAHWIGECLLSVEEQKKIRKQALLDYEQERSNKTFHNPGIMQKLNSGNSAKGLMAILAFVGMGLLKNSDNLWKFVRRSGGDDLVEKTIIPIGSKIVLKKGMGVNNENDKNNDKKPLPLRYSWPDTYVSYSRPDTNRQSRVNPVESNTIAPGPVSK